MDINDGIFDYNIWMMVIMGLYAYYNVGPPPSDVNVGLDSPQ